MTTFVMLGQYSSEGLRQVSRQRTEKAVEMIERFGGKLSAMYATLGDYDLVFIVAFPGVNEAMKASVALAKLTGIGFKSLPAVTAQGVRHADRRGVRGQASGQALFDRLGRLISFDRAGSYRCDSWNGRRNFRGLIQIKARTPGPLYDCASRTGGGPRIRPPPNSPRRKRGPDRQTNQTTPKGDPPCSAINVNRRSRARLHHRRRCGKDEQRPSCKTCSSMPPRASRCTPIAPPTGGARRGRRSAVIESLFATVTNVDFDPPRLDEHLVRPPPPRQGPDDVRAACRKAGKTPETLGGPAAWQPAADLRGPDPPGRRVSVAKQQAAFGRRRGRPVGIDPLRAEGGGRLRRSCPVLGREDAGNLRHLPRSPRFPHPRAHATSTPCSAGS